MAIRDDVMILLGEVEMDKVDVIIHLISSKLLSKLKAIDSTVLKIPEELEYIAVEISIARFNRIGSEGLSSETIEGNSANYQDLFTEYNQDIRDWLQINNLGNKTKGKVAWK